MPQDKKVCRPNSNRAPHEYTSKTITLTFT